jgi:hypothetical protein
MTDDLERQLRDRLQHAQLPSAPDRLHARVVQAAVTSPAQRRTSFRGRWLLLPIAALLVIALGAGLLAVGGRPSQLSVTARSGDFRLTLSSAKPVYAMGEQIDVSASVEYTGPDDYAQVSAEQSGLVYFSVQQLDGSFSIPGGGSLLLRCSTQTLFKGSPFTQPLGQALSYPGHLLSTGTYRITATASFGSTDCYKPIDLGTSLVIRVGRSAASPSPTRADVQPSVALQVNPGPCGDPTNAVWASGGGLTVAQSGDVVLVALVVPMVDVTEVFPWSDVTSSDATVLRPIPMCAGVPSVFSLPVRYSAFEAVAPGTAWLSAPLSPDWQPPAPAASGTDLGPIRFEVDVTASATPAPTPTPTPTPKFVTPGPTPWPSNACGGFHLKVVNEETASITVTINDSYTETVDGGTSQTIVEWLPPNKPLMPWTVVVTGAAGTQIGSAYMTGPVDQKIIVSGGQMEYGPYDIRTEGCD